MQACSSHNKCINYNGLASDIMIVVYNNSIAFVQFVLALSVQYGISREYSYVLLVQIEYSSTIGWKENTTYIYLNDRVIPPHTVHRNILANRPHS